jgi:hypothetical protein
MIVEGPFEEPRKHGNVKSFKVWKSKASFRKRLLETVQCHTGRTFPGVQCLTPKKPLKEPVDRIVEMRVLGFALNEVGEPWNDVCLKKGGFGKFRETCLLKLGKGSGNAGDESGSNRNLPFWVEKVTKISLWVLAVDYLVREGKSWFPFDR